MQGATTMAIRELIAMNVMGFQWLAEVLKRAGKAFPDDVLSVEATPSEAVAHIANAIADELEAQVHNFNRAQFLRDCGCL
jgi:hypothetical protein